MEYVWKSKIEFNFKLNNHRKGVNRQNTPEADMHFNLPSHNFRQHARFTLSKLALWPSNDIWSKIADFLGILTNLQVKDVIHRCSEALTKKWFWVWP